MRLTNLLVLVAMIATFVGCASSSSRSKARNSAILESVFSEVWSKGNVDLIDQLYAPGFIGHFPGETFRGREGIRSHVIAHRKAFPDWTETIQDTIIERDKIVARFTSQGTNLGEFLGKPPTGNHIKISEVAIFKIEDGMIVEQWVYPDMLSMQQQLLR
jgi:steroid delta-isomerase-like uncharacterized protein